MVAEGLFGPPAPLFSAVSVFASLLLTPLRHASLDMQVDTMAQILTMARDRHAGMKTFRALVLDSVTLLQGFPPLFFHFFVFATSPEHLLFSLAGLKGALDSVPAQPLPMFGRSAAIFQGQGHFTVGVRPPFLLFPPGFHQTTVATLAP